MHRSRPRTSYLSHGLCSFFLSAMLLTSIMSSRTLASAPIRTRAKTSPSFRAASPTCHSRSSPVLMRRRPSFSRQQWQQRPSFKAFADEQSMKAGGFNTAGEAPFEIRGFSLGNAVLGVGSLILAASFSTFLKGDASGGSGIGFVYGVPIMLIGFALKYAELQPVPLVTDLDASSLFEAKASENLKKMKQDVTRHRYGDEAHMDTALKALGLWVAGKAPPKLMRIKEQVDSGELLFTMYFESPGTPVEMWTDPLMKIKLEKFFGPGVTASVEPLDEEGKDILAVQFKTGVPAGESDAPKTSVAQADDPSVVSVNLAEKPLGAVISEADTLVKSVNAKAESLGIKPGMRIQAINGYKVTKLNWLQAYKTFDTPMIIEFWVPEELRDPTK